MQKLNSMGEILDSAQKEDVNREGLRLKAVVRLECIGLRWGLNMYFAKQKDHFFKLCFSFQVCWRFIEEQDELWTQHVRKWSERWQMLGRVYFINSLKWMSSSGQMFWSGASGTFKLIENTQISGEWNENYWCFFFYSPLTPHSGLCWICWNLISIHIY